MKIKDPKSLVQIHTAVFLFGAAGLFGKISGIHPLEIVFGRVLFATIALYLFSVMTGNNLRIRSSRDLIVVLSLGILLAFHWYAFFMSIRLSTVATGLLTYSTFPVFVALIGFLFLYFTRHKFPQNYFQKTEILKSSILPNLIHIFG